MIKAGYMLEIESWENDADNYKTVRIHGLTDEQVRMYLCILSLFKAITGYGNLYEGCESEKVAQASAAVVSILQQYEASESEIDHATDDITDYMTQFLDSGQDYTFRAYDSHKVFYFPQAIMEVTEKF